MSYGYYVIASAHYDDYECDPPWIHSGNARYGWSETAENEFSYHFINKGYDVNQDCCWLHNQEDFRAEGNHIWLNNGYATSVHVPVSGVP